MYYIQEQIRFSSMLLTVGSWWQLSPLETGRAWRRFTSQKPDLQVNPLLSKSIFRHCSAMKAVPPWRQFFKLWSSKPIFKYILLHYLGIHCLILKFTRGYYSHLIRISQWYTVILSLHSWWWHHQDYWYVTAHWKLQTHDLCTAINYTINYFFYFTCAN
jgi:hypothetical protein